MASLDMSLEDMIKSRRKTDRGRGQGRPQRGRGGPFKGGRMAGVPRRGGGPLRVNSTRMGRTSAFTIAKSIRRPKNFPWQRDLLEESLRAVGLPGIENGAKLSVSNLDGGVSNEDIRELFSEIGELKRYAIHYDKNGQPSGSAEVVFARRSDAFQAMKRYNNVQLDGKPMKIEVVGANTEIPLSARVNVVGGVNGRRTVVMTPGMARGGAAFNRISGQRSRGGMKNSLGGMMNNRGGMMNNRGGGRGNSSGRGRGGAQGGGRGRGGAQGGGRGRGRGRGGKRNVDKSVDELDKELENYHAESMQT